MSDVMNNAKASIGEIGILGGASAIRGEVLEVGCLLAAIEQERDRVLAKEMENGFFEINAVVQNCSRGMQSRGEAVSQVSAFSDWGDGQKPMARYKIQRKRQEKKKRKGMRR